MPGSAAPLVAARRLRSLGLEPSLLLSAQTGRHGRRSLLAARPDRRLVVPAGAGPSLPSLLADPAAVAGGAGLWLGALSYEAGLELLGIRSRHAPTTPAALLAHHATYAEYDHAADRWRVHGVHGEERLLLEQVVSAPPEPAAAAAPPASRAATSGVDRAGYAERVREAQRLIGLGEAFEINLSHVLETPWELGGWDLFERLVAAAPGDHAAYLAGDGIEIASVSPELFVRVEGGVAESRPVKGTRPRATDPDEDERLAVELLRSEKDRAENVMIVDLVRNDLTRSAVAGSVRVAELCVVERTPSVQHLVSSVTASVRPDVTPPEVLLGLFPGGSVTGAPKRRAMELIDRLEVRARGVYCGAVLAWEPGLGRLSSSIAIRTATVADGRARYGAGGAVTLLSDPDGEAAEALVKARPFLQATGAIPEGWERS